MRSASLFTFQTKLFIYLSLTLALFAVIGTLSHEGGHWLVMRYYGFKDAHINYMSTSPGKYRPDSLYKDLRHVWERNSVAIESHKPFAEEARYNELSEKWFRRSIMISAGGPLQTILTGTIGLVLLFIYRKSYRGVQALKIWQWLIIIISLFWMRQLFNLATSILLFISKGKLGHGDEGNISRLLGLPRLTADIIGGSIAAIILAVIFFRFIPVQQRFTFVLASLVGGIGGSGLWLSGIGHIVMP